MSDYHPESWNPMWSVASILSGLLSFMVEETSTVGSIKASKAERRRLAAASHEFNAKDKIFCALFPQAVGGPMEELGPSSSSTSSSSSSSSSSSENGKGGDSWASLVFTLVLAGIVVG